MGDIALGLKDILTSKLDSAHRNPALHLAAALCHLFGLEWAATVGTQFLVLLVDLFNVVSQVIHCIESCKDTLVYIMTISQMELTSCKILFRLFC